MKAFLRMALVVASIIAVISSTSAVASFSTEISAGVAVADAVPIASDLSSPTTPESAALGAAPARVTEAPQSVDCSRTSSGYCVEIPTVRSQPPAARPATQDGSCRLPDAHNEQGTITVIPGTVAAPATVRVIRYRIEIEDGLAIDPTCFAASVGSILADPRGWSGTGTVGFQRVDDRSYDFRLILASPDMTDALCSPAATGGRYSCRNGDEVVLNLMRWESGTDDFSAAMDTYRRYLVNHEVGHLLGEGHRSCPSPGLPAPVMMQQTKGVGECTPNGWPTVDER